jgi:hypothetical protein
MLSFKKFLLEIFDAYELAAAHVHDEWMKRNPKEDRNASQHVPYENLPEHEKEKDRAQIRRIIDIAEKHGLDPSNSEHHNEIINHFGSAAHEEWRSGHEAKNGVGTPKMRNTADGLVNINVPWAKLHPHYQRENIAAARAAITAHTLYLNTNI